MASLSYFQGGYWMNFPYEKEPRKPKIQVVHATPQLVKFTLTNTDSSVANALRRIIMAEVPTMAIEIVNVEDNDSVLFDEFICHRLGLLPLACNFVGDMKPDDHRLSSFVEHKDCNCFDGCQYCTVEFKLDVTNSEDRVLNVTHFDLKETDTYKREFPDDSHRIRPLPFRDESKDFDQETRDNGILICKLKKDQSLRMVCLARKGIPKYHAKFMPVATCCMRYQPIVKLDEDMVNALPLDDKIDFVQACPRRVFELDEDKVRVDKLQECIFCDECCAKARELKQKDMVTVKQDQDTFHFIVESVTPDGPKSVIDVVRAALRVFDYKLQLLLKDTYGDDIGEVLPYDPPYARNTFR